VADVLALVDHLGLGPVALVGQSLGGQTAYLVAARHPEVVRALVVAEASPTATAAASVDDLRSWLESWPLPFASLEAAKGFFGGGAVSARAWASALEERGDGWWPSFDLDVVVETLAAAVGHDYWEEWDRILVPTLLVRGAEGSLSVGEAREMVARLPEAHLVEIPAAGHDVHLDAPERWRAAVEPFLASSAGE
jgi:pimeloyl-ACP methyl ester carboxylesterase